MSGESCLSTIIEHLVDEFLADPSPDPLGLRQIVSRVQMLPLFLDMGGCYALRPDGDLVSFAWDAPNDSTMS
jgi:hypothetical protein